MDTAENIRYDSDMLRPVMKGTEIEVHKIADQVWNQNISTKLIVNDYYLKSGITEIANYEDAEGMLENESDDKMPIELTEEDVKKVVEYANMNRGLIESIIEEDKKLKSIIFNNNGEVKKTEEIQSELSKTEFEYYNVSFKNTSNGFSISWSQNSG